MNRAVDELPGLLNGSPSHHTSRPIPRSTEKRPSSVSPEKAEKPPASLSSAQSNHNSIITNNTNNHQPDSGGLPMPTSELGPDSSATASALALERLNMNLFEWPRIYLSFSKKEKEDELLAVKSTKLPQGPKKRAKLGDKSSYQHPEAVTTTTTITNSSSNNNNNSDNNHNNINGSIKNHAICESSVATPGGGDVLLQWGHNKRSRGSRSDGGSAQGRQVVKIPRRVVVTSSDKPCQPVHQNHQMATAAGYTRGANLRPCTPVRESHSRNLDELPTLLNGSPSSNNTRPISRSTDKRTSASPEKAEKPLAACPPLPVPSNNSHQPDSNGPVPAAEPSVPAAAVPEKVNLDLFEWPKIYISLSRKDKEDDFLAIKGTKLPQRPKRRAKIVERNLQYCFPGMWLCDLSRGRYEVREKKCVKKM